MTTEMEMELRDHINHEIDKKQSNKEFLAGICAGYLDYYFMQSDELQRNFKKLLTKYNDETILNFLSKNGDPEWYTHLSLGHNMGEKNLYPMLDNGGGIFPADREIGQLTTSAPHIRYADDSDEEMELRWQFHDLIFYAWLSINWIQVRGYEVKIVVKTTENNSCTSWFLNDFQFDSNSRFDNTDDWKDAISKFTRDGISMPELIENIKEGLSWTN